MENELEELESLYSDHLGRTPSASQVTENDSDSSSDNDVDVGHLNEGNLLNVDERAQRFLNEDSISDSDEEIGKDPCYDKIVDLKESGCGCQRNCLDQHTVSDMYSFLLNLKEMEKSEQELLIMASLIGNIETETTQRGKKRQRSHYQFTFKGRGVCKKTFMVLFNVGKHALQNIMKHVQEHGVTPRVHKNSGRKPLKALDFETIKAVVQFLSNFADEFGIPQPAAPRDRDGDAPVYLPSDNTKVMVHQLYTDTCAQKVPPIRVVKYSTFNNIWRSCMPHIKIANPREDVCATCEMLRKLVADSVTEEEKLESTQKLQEHVLLAQKERETYNTCVKRAREAGGNDHYVQYTFDFSQNVCIPHHARQMGPVYFTSLRKVQIFGFRIDGIPSQLNFLIDVNETIGSDGSSTHGPNAVLSMIHWALETRHSHESACVIHADNCPEQNKNRYVIGYLLWRVMTGRHQTIELMMQVPGHARCLIDSGFASLKKLYRRSDCDTIEQLEVLVNKSSTTNQAVRYPAWQWRDWRDFLEPSVRAIPGIRKFQYFRVNVDRPGVVVVKYTTDGAEFELPVLRPRARFADGLPRVIAPAGLSRQRQEYLYTHVRPYVRQRYQDTTCPPPAGDR